MKKEHICDIKEPFKLYRIGMFASMNHVTVKTLRYYDEQGLLKPVSVDTATGYRYYTAGQLPVIHQILVLRNMGFSLEEIKGIQRGESEEVLLRAKKRQLLAEIAEKTAKLAQVECYLSSENINTNYHVLIKKIPEVTVAYMKKRLPDYGAMFDVMPAMGKEMERLGCVCAEPEYCFTIYHDGEHREEDIDAEICEAVTEEKPDSELVQFKVIPEVQTAACVLHKGSYERFPEAYAAVIRFIEENGYEICGSPRESYIDGVWNKETESEWLSEVQFPVRKIVKEDSIFQQ
ncbi:MULTISPECIES: MerR family transcriptional regulator [Clostridia]|uniref:MerR family transcriptional regulator n=1 Tax=Clostridia TaxID=186801 RepID=UPI00067F663E|nr:MULTISPECIES: MerR family transcriptional regulator [Clostridia]